MKNQASVVERLKRSREKEAKEDRSDGAVVGRMWAEELAGCKELSRVAAIAKDTSGVAVSRAWIAGATLGNSNADPTDVDGFWEQVCSHVGGPIKQHDDDFLQGFVDGAAEVWNQVADKL